MHTLDSKFRYMINITLPKWFHSSPGWDSERRLVFSPRRACPQASPTSPSCWLPWWKWDTRSVFHWHCMGQCCCSLVMKLTGLPLLLLYFHHTETYFENAVNNGSFSKHGVSWQSILNGLWGYWAITLQCLLSAQLMSSVAQQQIFTASLTGLKFSIQ